MLVTGPHLKQARQALGWTPAELARALRLAGGPSQGEKRVLEMESGRRDISGPVAVAVEIVAGPEGFDSVTVNPSVGSNAVSPMTLTLIVAVV